MGDYLARVQSASEAEASTLFIVQRSTNDNTVVYLPNVLPDGTLHRTVPVTVHWRRFTEDGRVMCLRAFERVACYGVGNVSVAADGMRATFYLNAAAKRSLTVFYTGTAFACGVIGADGTPQQLLGVFAQVGSFMGAIPKLDALYLMESDGTGTHRLREVTAS